MNIEKEEQTTKPTVFQTLARIALGGMLLFTGTTHLTMAREEFKAQVPKSLPVNEDFVVVASGITELLLGSSLAGLPQHRVLLGWIAAAFFVAIFPGNISQYINRIDAFGMDTDEKRLGRLFIQPIFVVWALWATGAWQALREQRAEEKDS